MEKKIIVCKFGGSSVKKEGIEQNIKQIVEENQNRRIIVVSAPGKAQKKDKKVTDLLISASLEQNKFDFWMNEVQSVFEDLIFRLKVDFDVECEIRKIKRHFRFFKSKSYLFSRGEYLSAKIFAKYLDAKFVDAAKLIKFYSNGKIHPRTYRKIKKMVKKFERIVIPGFYGSTSFGKIKVMSRGGSDITGAICARALPNSVYENWTDVDGFFEDNESAIVIEKMNYDDMKFLSFFGSSVVHSKCANICEESKMILKNTFNRSVTGTTICKNVDSVSFGHATRSCVEFCLKVTQQNREIIKKLKAEILFKQVVMGKLFIGISFSRGYSSERNEKKLQKAAFCVRNVDVDAYILQKSNQIQAIKKKHDHAHIILNDGNRWVFVEEKV